MTGLFRKSIQAMSKDIREMNVMLSENMKEIKEAMRKLVDEKED